MAYLIKALSRVYITLTAAIRFIGNCGLDGRARGAKSYTTHCGCVDDPEGIVEERSCERHSAVHAERHILGPAIHQLCRNSRGTGRDREPGKKINLVLIRDSVSRGSVRTISAPVCIADFRCYRQQREACL